jgi:NitT/TauT family transport system ATP-binding protein
MMHDVISLKNVTKTFGGHAVLNNFSAEIPLCGVTVFRGASGAGKTTLFRLLMGLEKPDSGEICGLEDKKPAVVFQEDRLLPWSTALENAATGSDESRAREALVRLGLGDNLCQLPRELSGGMNRRVAIARALAYGGDVLFLDEPFTGLDEENKKIAADAMREANIPILVITHDDAEADLFGAFCEIRID